ASSQASQAPLPLPTLLVDRSGTRWEDAGEVASILSASSMPTNFSVPVSLGVASSWLFSTNSPALDKESSRLDSSVNSVISWETTKTNEASGRMVLDPELCREGDEPLTL
ncbi:unnamed protein product, partial [Effrenium voratum]